LNAEPVRALSVKKPDSMDEPGAFFGVARTFWERRPDLLFGVWLSLGFGLRELPALGFDEVFGMLLTSFVFPIVTPQETFDNDLLALLGH
jgi:hypothetical protein